MQAAAGPAQPSLPTSGQYSQYRPRDDLPDLPGYRLRHTLRGHGRRSSGAGMSDGKVAVTSVRFDGEGKRLASASNDGTAMIWDTDTGELLQTLKGHIAGISGECCLLAG